MFDSYNLIMFYNYSIHTQSVRIYIINDGSCHLLLDLLIITRIVIHILGHRILKSHIRWTNILIIHIDSWSWYRLVLFL